MTDLLTTSGIPLSLGVCFSIECMRSRVWQPRIVLCKSLIVLLKLDNIVGVLPNELSICTAQAEYSLKSP